MDEEQSSNIPALLPIEILEAEPPQRPLTPPIESRSRNTRPANQGQTSTSRKRNNAKIARDIVRGPVHVSLLPEQSRLLAPQVASRSKALHNMWAAGRPSLQSDKPGPRASKKARQHGRMERREPFALVGAKFA